MPGRLVFYQMEAVYDVFNARIRDEVLGDNYNATPGSILPVLGSGRNGYTVSLMHWGFIPHWSKDRKDGYKMINARSESISQKPAFRDSFFQKRCVIPVRGWYEWQVTERGKIPLYLHQVNQQLLPLAGIFSVWRDEKERPMYSFATITTEPNAFVRPIHHRMPAILEPSGLEIWLDPSINDERNLIALLKPYEQNDLIAHQVSSNVNTPANNDSSLILPV